MRAVAVGQRARRTWRYADVALHQGWLEVPLAGHAVLLLALAASVWTLSGDPHLGLVVLGYTLLLGPRLLHELAHAVVGRHYGCQVRQVLLGPLAANTRFAGHTSARARRLGALAGPVVQAAVGSGLVLLAWAGVAWPAPPRELVVLLGLLHVAGLANLLPWPGMDGAALVGRTWDIQLRWPGQVLPGVVLLVLVLVVVGALFPVGFVRATLDVVLQPAVLVIVLLVLTGVWTRSHR